MKNQQKQLTLRLPEDLHRRLKVCAAQKGKTMLEIIIELVETYLEREGV